MDRKIPWNSYLLDEIELVYEKAESNQLIGDLLEKLEQDSLEEAKAYCCANIKDAQGNPITPESFDEVSDNTKEGIIDQLGKSGLANIGQDIATATITMQLSPHIQSVKACTFFNIINRLEKLDGALEIIAPKWTLELQAPLGGKKGLMQWEMLIAALYPWLNVKETSTDQIATEAKAAAPDNESKPQQEDTKQTAKKGSGDFFLEMKEKEPFKVAYQLAKEEVATAIKSGAIAPKIAGKPVTYSDWNDLGEMHKLNLVLSTGNYGISVESCICVDFCETLPNCIAIMLLYGAWDNQLPKQLIDAGDGADVTKFVEALNRVYPCHQPWECTIAHPVMVKIGKTTQTKNEEPPKKKPFWKKLFG